MRNNFLIFIICLFNFNALGGSNSNSINFFESYQKATIHFLDGTSIQGYAKIIDIFEISKIKFKVSIDGDSDIWTHIMLKGVTYHYDSVDVVYHYVEVYEIGSPKLLELYEDGVVNLYVDYGEQWVNNGFDEKTGFPNNPGQKKGWHRFYAKKEIDLIAFKFGLFDFKKGVKRYFQDCPGIINKINSGAFNRNDIPEIVYYYNDFCAEYE